MLFLMAGDLLPERRHPLQIIMEGIERSAAGGNGLGIGGNNNAMAQQESQDLFHGRFGYYYQSNQLFQFQKIQHLFAAFIDGQQYSLVLHPVGGLCIVQLSFCFFSESWSLVTIVEKGTIPVLTSSKISCVVAKALRSGLENIL